MAWLISSARLTLFVTPAAERIEAPAWQELVGAAPENRVERLGIMRAEGGAFGRGRLTLQLQQAARRIDLLYAPAPRTGEAEAATIGSFDEVVQQVQVPWERLLRSGFETVRIAFGVSHLQKSPDLSSAYRILQEAVKPTRLNLENAQDFLYRMNRPRTSNILRGLTINRLATWSGVMLQTMEINTATGETNTFGPEAFGAGLETDFSTDQARREPIASIQLLALLDELQRLTAELAAAGDIP